MPMVRVSNGGTQDMILRDTINVKQQGVYTFPSGISVALVIFYASDQNNVAERWHISSTNCNIAIDLTLNSYQRYEKIARVSDISEGSSINMSYDYGYSATAYIYY